ncbi:hypothetical protein NHX12_006660 [Muraenolepis orangiensis]|uniref:Uncharacterized protein n=1 Tax=Muraenolepis orangiensis TaxID=630683 RepID=A0A9Q0DRY5_9TELE|nr:hypothetical protein NHX12_006660 [Muraenolepis orangiensis]
MRDPRQLPLLPSASQSPEARWKHIIAIRDDTNPVGSLDGSLKDGTHTHPNPKGWTRQDQGRTIQDQAGPGPGGTRASQGRTRQDQRRTRQDQCRTRQDQDQAKSRQDQVTMGHIVWLPVFPVMKAAASVTVDE